LPAGKTRVGIANGFRAERRAGEMLAELDRKDRERGTVGVRSTLEKIDGV
jgi:hypothetical protein